MSKNSIIFVLAGVLVVVGVGAFFVVQRSSAPNAQIDSEQTQTIKPVQPSSSGIVYDANGKLDTSGWQEYRSEYGGFSVRAPKGSSAIGCFGHACDPSIWGEHFLYVLFQTSINDEAGEVGLSIDVIKKDEGSTLDTWLDENVVSGRDKLSNVQKVSVGEYSALQFDIQKETSGAPSAMVRIAYYPLGNTYESGLVMSSYDVFRYLVIDLGDRYALVHRTLSIDKEALSRVYSGYGYLDYSRQALAIPDDKTLADVYAAILGSFRAFTPTKP